MTITPEDSMRTKGEDLGLLLLSIICVSLFNFLSYILVLLKFD